MHRRIGEGQETQIRHEATDVPEGVSPFASELEEKAFVMAMKDLNDRKLVPEGFRLSENYVSNETFFTGHAKNGLTIPLPYERWYPRIIEWCQALDLMTRIPLVANETYAPS